MKLSNLLGNYMTEIQIKVREAEMMQGTTDSQ